MRSREEREIRHLTPIHGYGRRHEIGFAGVGRRHLVVHAVVRAQPRVPCGRTSRCRDRGATPAFPRTLNLQGGVGAGKISCSPHPLRSTRRLSTARRNPNPFSVVNPSARRRSPEPQHAAASAVVLIAPVLLSFPSAAAKRNSLPSSHIRCIITTSLRATATTARLWPRLAAIRVPHALTLLHCFERTSMALAAS
jgi:hypothetical protein